MVVRNEDVLYQLYSTQPPTDKYCSCANNGGSVISSLVRVKESFKFSSSNRDTPESGSWWNVGGTMATRNLTEIYVNLRTEISRFKAYSLGDSGVRSDSPGVLWFHTPYTVLFSTTTRHNTRRTTVFDGFFCLAWTGRWYSCPCKKNEWSRAWSTSWGTWFITSTMVSIFCFV